MNFETLKISIKEPIATLTIDRPKALNALNAQVVQELYEALKFIETSKNLRALIITGAGEKSFVAGADIKEMQNLTSNEALKLSQTGQDVFNKIENLPIPVIAAVNGFALGGGFELALACDFIVASKNAKFGLPEVTLGLIPGYGGTQRLERVVGINNARYITFTGDMFDAETLLKMGAVTMVEEASELMQKAESIALILAKRGPLAIASAKKAILSKEAQDFTNGLKTEAQNFANIFNTLDKNEGITAFIEKRKPEFTGK